MNRVVDSVSLDTRMRDDIDHEEKLKAARLDHRRDVKRSREHRFLRRAAILGGSALAAGAIALAGYGVHSHYQNRSKQERAAEACISKLAGGRPINLVRDRDGEGFQHPLSVRAEQIVCERHGNNIAAAEADFSAGSPAATESAGSDH